MSITFTMIAPSGLFNCVARSGTAYTADASGVITSVSPNDVNDLEAMGCKFAGNTTQYIPLIECRTSSGAALPAAASSGIFGLSFVSASSVALSGEPTSSSTSSFTDNLLFLTAIPTSYVGGTNFNIIVNALWVSSGAGVTASSTTIAVQAWKLNSAGLATSSETLSLTSAQAVTSSAADYTFAINGNPSSGNIANGSLLMVKVTGVITCVSSAVNNIQINSIRINLP